MYVTLTIILLLFLFIMFLIIFGFSPQQMAEKIFKLLYRIDTSKYGRIMRIPAQSIRRLPENEIIHRPFQLQIETYEGTGQCVHPHIIYVSQGFSNNSAKYWMTITPYPFGNDRFENPSIYYSYDGLNWRIPLGLKNPVIDAPRGKGNHNSDPCLLFHEDSLFLYWRQTLKTNTGEINKLFLTKSLDGVNWSESILVVDNPEDTVMSPVVYVDNGLFIMWSINGYRWPYTLTKRESLNGVDWGISTTVVTEGLDHDRSPWHLDIVKIRDRLNALFVSCIGEGGVGARIHYGYSDDSGHNWVIRPYLLRQSYDFEKCAQYRGCLVKTNTDGPIFEMYYSALSNNSVWTIQYLPMILIGNDMYPLGSLSWKEGFE